MNNTTTDTRGWTPMSPRTLEQHLEWMAKLDREAERRRQAQQRTRADAYSILVRGYLITDNSGHNSYGYEYAARLAHDLDTIVATAPNIVRLAEIVRTLPVQPLAAHDDMYGQYVKRSPDWYAALQRAHEDVRP